MNSEFHYYSTAFLAVKAGFAFPEVVTLAYAGQYVDHHHRGLEILTPRGAILSGATQNFSFWDQGTVDEVLAPFHFLPAGLRGPNGPYPSVRRDGALSPWDVRPNSPAAKTLLVEALKTRNLHRIGLALHTFSDTWAHQNFTARNEDWNRIGDNHALPVPGHAAAGFAPDLWLEVWTDSRLLEPRIVNRVRFADCARKVYRYLCTFRGKDFRADEDEVAAELAQLVDAGRGRDTPEERSLEFILTLNLEPYDKTAWLSRALEESQDPETDHTVLGRFRRAGEDLLGRAGLIPPRRVTAKPGFEGSDLAAWVRAAEEHRELGKRLVRAAVGG